MGGENGAGIAELQEEIARLRAMVTELQDQSYQSQSEKLQLQTSYEEALQALADSEAKKETIERELRLAHEQISSMWKELESLHRKLDGPNVPVDSGKAMVNEGSLELQCTLCKEKIKPQERSPRGSPQESPRGSPQGSPLRPRRSSWLFGKKPRVQDLESHSKICSSHSNSSPKSGSNNPSPKILPKKSQSSSILHSSTPRKQTGNQTGTQTGNQTSASGGSGGMAGDFLIVNVTRTSTGVTDLAPFKVITKTNMTQFSRSVVEVYRSQGDFQWLYDALQQACPERVVPPLKPPISLDATMSEFQRFLSRLAQHKTLRKHHLFVIFLTGTTEELRSLKAKHRPRRQEEQVRYKPAVERDTTSGPLVSTKEYLSTLEQNILGLATHLEQSQRKTSATERTAHWFRAISESETGETYLKTAACDLARTCEAMEGQQADSDETLFIHNLQSVADFVRAAQDLLTRVEEAVDKFLYWDEEVTIMEAVTSSPVSEQLETSEDVVFDDSGVSDVTSSSNNSDPAHSDHMTGHVMPRDSTDSVSGISTSEKWAQASKYCADAKDYLEMMCQDLSEELGQFDLQKEKELKQVLLDYAAAQLEKHEKFQGKWFAMRFLLDTPILPEKRAIQFTNTAKATQQDSSEQGQ